jgi:hypothetical protein
MITMRRFLPAIANTPRRAAISSALIAGIAAGPLAGHASNHTATPTANPVVAAFTGASAPAQSAAEAPAEKAGDRVKTGAAKPASRSTDRQQPANASTGSSAPAAPAPPPQPSQSDLMPNGVPGDQSFITLDTDNMNNARAIIHATKELNLPPRAAVIAVATSLQETKLRNYGPLGDLNDHDSLGLFQQRPSTGWGTPDQLVNADYETKAFLGALIQVPGWQTMPLTDAAQTVQVSAFGDRYAQWEQQAADIVRDNFNNS